MIASLRISNLALAERVELEFAPGLNVLTGETGAGKSIVLGALSLLAGSRAKSDGVREGADEAVVEAVFDTRRLPELEANLAGRGLAGDAHELVVRRSVARNGRSRAQIAGQWVPVTTLEALFSGLLEISSQHESQALRRAESHGSMLDAFGALEAESAVMVQAYRVLHELAREEAVLREQAEARARREDFLVFQVQEIDAAGLRVGEYAALRLERGRLAHAEQLGRELAAACAALGGMELPEATSAADLLRCAARSLEELLALAPDLEPHAERVRTAAEEVGDAARELERYASGIEADPARLAEIEERLALIERLRRKYGASEEEALAFRESAAGELAALSHSDERLQKLAAERARAEQQLRTAAERLSAGRRRAAQALERAVAAEFRELALTGARFEVALSPAQTPEGRPSGPGGCEAPEFLFSANPGEPLQPLRRIASGGELSRVFLALKNVLRRADRAMVLVFDEVDAGVGGRVADRVGRVLAELAAEHQVLCITHLPQIAALASKHFRVEKRTRQGRTLTAVSALDPEARVEEIARMAGGARVSEATLRHARELLAGGVS